MDSGEEGRERRVGKVRGWGEEGWGVEIHTDQKAKQILTQD